MHHIYRRTVATSLALAVLAIGGCAEQSSTPSSRTSTGEPTTQASSSIGPAAEDTGVVSGRVTVRSNGQPYAGAIVEFRNVYKAELHTTTDSDGWYSITLPQGVYSAFALDLNDINAGFEVADGEPTTVSVPDDDSVDFVAYPIS